MNGKKVIIIVLVIISGIISSCDNEIDIREELVKIEREEKMIKKRILQEIFGVRSNYEEKEYERIKKEKRIKREEELRLAGVKADNE